MSVIDLMIFMGEQGARFRRNEIEPLMEYLSNMLIDERIVVIYENGKISGLITYSVCDDFEPYCANSSWDYLPQNCLGHKVFIEMMICKKWTKDIRNLFEEKIIERYPNIEEGIWLRGQRLIRTKRRHYAKS